MQSIQGIERSVKRRIQVALGSIILMTLLVGIFILHPEYSRAAEARDEIKRLEHESGSMVSTESRLQALEAELVHRMAIERNQLRDVPTGADEAGLADALALNVDDGGASSWSVRMLDPEEVDSEDVSPEWMCQPAVIEMEGRFDTVIGALRRVEDSDRLVRVRMLRVGRPRGSTSDPGLIDASVELDTVFVREEER